MAHAYAFISCLLAALFLVVNQGECTEISGFEPETEVECCVLCREFAVCTEAVEADQPDVPVAVSHRTCALREDTAAPVRMRPIRILYCVFRE